MIDFKEVSLSRVDLNFALFFPIILKIRSSPALLLEYEFYVYYCCYVMVSSVSFVPSFVLSLVVSSSTCCVIASFVSTVPVTISLFYRVNALWYVVHVISVLCLL